MKKLFIFLLAAAFLFAFAGCSQAPEAASESPSRTASAEAITTSPIIGLVFAQKEAYYERMEKEAQAIAQDAGYELLTYYPDSDAQQVTDIYAAIGAGAQSIMIIPRNMDNMQTVLDECDMQSIPVINLMVPINGVVDTLVCPDYQLMGLKGADAVRGALGEEERANVFLLESAEGSFVSQLMHDGFVAQAADIDGVHITDAQIIQRGQDTAYAEIARQLKYDEDINAIFVSDETFVPGVLRAVTESGRNVKIVCVGGSREIMDMVKAGDVAASVFVSPVELAQIAVEYAVKCASDPNYTLPQYTGMTVETIFPTDVDKYSAFGEYADALTNKIPPSPSPSLRESPLPSGGQASPSASPSQEEDGQTED
jgi:ABC-type sugar transport system substrate-binding protein